MKKLLMLCAVLNFLMFGCGGSSDGLLATSSVTATIDTRTLDADIVAWTDAAACSGGSIPAADSVAIQLSFLNFHLQR